jgi:dTDP-4-dehydrorhamnose reductase
MKILIVGGRGQLGRELVQQGPRWHFEILAPSHQQLDITSNKATKQFIQYHQPACVINAAAYTQVDRAEIEEALAFAVNKSGCTNLAQICASNDIPLFQISTDYVFDGQKNTPYRVSDPIAPIGVYGRSKAAGEAETRSNCKEHIIIRTSWLYSIHGQNFVKTMLKLAATRETIQVVSDQYGSPTSAEDLANAVLAIADQWRRKSAVDWGTYHYCGLGIISWYEFAKAIIDYANRWGEVKTCRIEPVTTAQYPTKARRPTFSALDCTLIKNNFGINPKPWRNSLKDTIQRLFAETAASDGPPLKTPPQ